MEDNRIHWIDIARGIGIIAVIYGHTLSWDSHRYILYAFHIPLFFFIAGLVHHYKKSQHFIQILRKTIRNNLIPYFVFALLTYITVIILHSITDINIQSILYQLIGIVYGNANLGFLSFNVALWFLPCLFITKLGFFLIEKISDNEKFLFPILVIFSLIGYFTSVNFRHMKLPFGIETALTGIVFFGFGYLIEKRRERIYRFLKRYGLFILPVSISITIYFATLNYDLAGYQIDMRLNKLANYLYFYLASLSGIISVLTFSILLGQNKILEYIGKFSLILYVWQWLVISELNSIIKNAITVTTFIKDIYLAPLITCATITIILYLNKFTKHVSVNYLRKNT